LHKTAPPLHDRSFPDEETKEGSMARATQAVPKGYHTVTPQLTLDNCAQALEWYKKGLGAEDVNVFPGPDGKVMHAEMRIGNSKIMLNDALMGAKGPRALGGSPASLWIYVEDCDALFNRALSAGAQVVPGGMGAMQDQFWGDRWNLDRSHGWTIATHRKTSPQRKCRRVGPSS
jgi:uncharacterized glyoxalase superfamily protein PhnB